MENKQFITVLVPTYNEERFISSCIESIINQNYPKEMMEVLIIDGISSDSTREIVNEYTTKFNFIELIDNPGRIVPKALNIGVKRAKGEYIIRLDAHSKYPKEYFSTLIDFSQKLKADNVGGVCITDVKNQNSKSLAICEVLSNRFGVGNSIFRLGTNKILEVDTVVFGCFRKEVFEKYGFFDERLVRNQDIEFNKRIKNGGGKLFIIPEVTCTYYARENFKDLFENNFKNGYWNILTVFYTKILKSLSLRHFLPLFFVLSLIVPPILSMIFFPFIYISIFSLGLYLVFSIIVSISILFKKNLNLGYLFLSFLVLHISYGLGSFICLIKLPFLHKHENV